MTKNVFERALTGLRSFFETWRFPVFLLSSLLFYNLMVIAIVLIPPSETAMGTFAEDFKRWCFRYDPVTGAFDWGYVVPFFTAPLVMITATLMVYWSQLRLALRSPR